QAAVDALVDARAVAGEAGHVDRTRARRIDGKPGHAEIGHAGHRSERGPVGAAVGALEHARSVRAGVQRRWRDRVDREGDEGTAPEAGAHTGPGRAAIDALRDRVELTDVHDARRR